jgi:peptidoglycan/LPS O-acetylase OafA/YrhL
MHTEFFGSLFIFAFLGIFKSDHRIQWKVISVVAVCLLSFSPYLSCFVLGYVLSELNDLNRAMSRGTFDVAIATCFFGAAIAESFVSGNDTYSSVLAFIVVFSAMRSRILRCFFSNSISAFLGRISFPLYLMQIVVICSWSSYLVLKSSGLSNATAAFTVIWTTEILCLVSGWFLLPIERLSVTASKFLARSLVSMRPVNVEREEPRGSPETQPPSPSCHRSCRPNRPVT